jgi:mRNA interferase HigB
MHVIKLGPLRDFWRIHPQARRPLLDWYQTARRARWRTIFDVRRVYPHADAVAVSGRTATVFNVAGNHYRLIVVIHYNRQKIYIRYVLTHAEYDRGKWKTSL